MNSIVALFTALLLWLSPAESDSRFTKYKLSSANTGQTVTSACATYADLTNLSVSLKTTGRVVFVGMIRSGTTTGRFYASQTGVTSQGFRVSIVRDATTISIDTASMQADHANQAMSIGVPVSSFYVYDFPSAGTYTYKVAACATNGNVYLEGDTKLLAYELQ